jgi:flavin-binding protein dodecin
MKATLILLYHLFISKFKIMSIVKVLEVMSNSTKSWEDATQNAVNHAAKTLHNIRSVWVAEQSAVVTNDKITEFRVTVKLSFEIDLMEKRKAG